MTDALPTSLMYNLNRLGQAGDRIEFSANEKQRAALARTADVLAVSRLDAQFVLRKLSPNRFALSCELAADITQACVVTLEPLAGRIARAFERELHFTPKLRGEREVVISPEDDEIPEEIDSLHYDLAGPLTEEFLLAIDPYPRAPGVEFAPPPEAQAVPENPFAALKGLKRGE